MRSAAFVVAVIVMVLTLVGLALLTGWLLDLFRQIGA